MNTPRTLALVGAVLLALLISLPAENYASAIRGGNTSWQDDDAEREKKKKEREDKDKKGDDEDSQLGDFEDEATDDNPSKGTVVTDDDLEAYGFAARVALYAVVGGSLGSWYRVTGEPASMDDHFGLRRVGDPGLPYVSLTLSYQNVASDVEGLDAYLEGGFGPIGGRFRSTKFREESPDAELDLTWFHGVWRMSYTDHFEVGFGVGVMHIDGLESNNGGSFMMAFNIDPSTTFGFYYRPTWGWINDNTVSDHDLGIRLGVPYVSLRLGYRWTSAGSTTLEGTTVGLSLSF